MSYPEKDFIPIVLNHIIEIFLLILLQFKFLKIITYIKNLSKKIILKSNLI